MIRIYLISLIIWVVHSCPYLRNTPTAMPTYAPTTAFGIGNSPTLAPVENNPTVAPTVVPTVAPTVINNPTTSSDLTGSGAFCLKTNGASLQTDANKVCTVSKLITTDFLNLLNSKDELFKSQILGKVVRLAFHDAAEYDQSSTDTLGVDGCLSNDFQNKGLIEETSIVNTLIEPIWQTWCIKSVVLTSGHL